MSDVAAGDTDLGKAPSHADRGPTLGTALLLLVFAWGAVIASFPLDDNSFFTHLATGRLILDQGAVPRADPYTFTALGAPWTVQSWLASVLYATGERVGGDAGLRFVVLVLVLIATALLWRITRPLTSVFSRIAVVFLAMFTVTHLWTPRPFLFGVIGLALVWLALQGAFSPWWLVPAMWVWANAHGSFPLAVVLVLSVLAGRRLDRLGNTAQVRVLVATLVGSLVAAVGPLGVSVLTFPVTAITRSAAFVEVSEWQAPDYQTISERAFLVLALATLAALVRRPRWRTALPALVFIAAGLLAQRNIVMAVVVLVGVLAESVGQLGTLTVDDRPRLRLPLIGVVGVACAGAVALALLSPAVDELDGYPVRSLAWMEAVSPDVGPGRVAVQDRTGNLLEVLDGAEGALFIDDRVDMFPEEVFADAVALHRGAPNWDQILDRYRIDVVVWERRRPLASLLAASDDWRIAMSESTAVVACRRDRACPALTGRSVSD